MREFKPENAHQTLGTDLREVGREKARREHGDAKPEPRKLFCFGIYYFCRLL